MVQLSASGYRDSNGVRVLSDEEEIPYLYQWVRDYVDKRNVTDGLRVLEAEVNLEEDNVEELTINSRCASGRAVREAGRVDTINLAEW